MILFWAKIHSNLIQNFSLVHTVCIMSLKTNNPPWDLSWSFVQPFKTKPPTFIFRWTFQTFSVCSRLISTKYTILNGLQIACVTINLRKQNLLNKHPFKNKFQALLQDWSFLCSIMSMVVGGVIAIANKEYRLGSKNKCGFNRSTDSIWIHIF